MIRTSYPSTPSLISVLLILAPSDAYDPQSGS
jgi:hypothetical protein